MANITYTVLILCEKHKDSTEWLFYTENAQQPKMVRQILIKSGMFMFKSYLFLNIKTYKIQTVSSFLIDPTEMIKLKMITLHLPEPYIKALDNLVYEKYYPNRAEAIRTAVRDLLSIEAWGRSRNG
jgi:hypothetical protein